MTTDITKKLERKHYSQSVKHLMHSRGFHKASINYMTTQLQREMRGLLLQKNLIVRQSITLQNLQQFDWATVMDQFHKVAPTVVGFVSAMAGSMLKM